MNRRKLIGILTAGIGAIGVLFVAVPFVGSMAPSDVAKSAARVRIAISEIPEKGAFVADYQGYKALVVRNPDLEVFLMPYYDGAYQLPDPTWERPIVPCKNFIISSEGFSCEDPSLHKSWNEQATWDLSGKSKGTWMPDLQKAQFRIEGKYIVLNPEYKYLLTKPLKIALSALDYRSSC